ncbi:MAG: zinc metallopeptidase [Bacteroidota bacterium]|jgi:Zn-dependent membrane protease YugP
MFDPFLMLIGIVFMVIGMAVSYRLKNKFKQYSQDTLLNRMTGKQVAEKMLRDNGIYDVKVVSHSGFLSDHYNPADKTVNLSGDVYNGSHVASAAVAAHECGHAIQHANAYKWLGFRSAMVPVVQFSSYIMNMLVFAFMFGAYFAPKMGNTFLLVYIICQSVVTLFSIITLPVEVDASKRALAWLNTSGITYGEEHEKAKDALTWAAYTYFVSALAAIATLVYLIMSFLGRRDE